MLDDIREAFQESVEHLTWMDESTKKATLDKSNNMYSFIGFPSWLFEEGKLEEYYKNVSSSFNLSFLFLLYFPHFVMYLRKF